MGLARKKKTVHHPNAGSTEEVQSVVTSVVGAGDWSWLSLCHGDSVLDHMCGSVWASLDTTPPFVHAMVPQNDSTAVCQG